MDYNYSSDSSSKPTSQPAKPNKHKSQALEDILHEFGPIERVSYTPFQTEEPRSAKALLPSTFPTQPHPYDYFTLFLPPISFIRLLRIPTDTRIYKGYT